MSVEKRYVDELVAAVESVHLSDKVVIVPFGTVNALSKVKVDLEPAAASELTTLEPVVNDVPPLYIAQPERLPRGPVAVVA